MKCFLVLVFLLCCAYGKEQVIYKATGADLFDLVRGIPPKAGAVELTKVEESDPSLLPDGIYFVPEDVPLDGVEPTKLFVSKAGLTLEDKEQKPAATAQ